MKTSDSITKITPALLKAQTQITFAAKDAVNGHLRNTYADLASVIDAIKPALNGAGIVFLQSSPESDDPARLRLTTRLMHESGEWMEETLSIPLPKQDPQGYGSAMTYARRYALAAMVGLYQDDDDGNAARQSRAEARRQAATPPTWPDEAWQATLPNLVAGIAQGKTIEAALQWASAKGQVTPKQELQLRQAVAKAQQPQEQPPQGIDLAQLEQAMANAANLDDLYEQAALMDAVTDEGARLRLNEIFDAKVKELEAAP